MRRRLNSQADPRSLRIYVAVATVGRAAILGRTLGRLSLQTRRPDGIVVVGAAPADIAGAARAYPGAQLILCEKGSCRQRNAALDLLVGRADVVIFFDDDFVPAPDFIEQVETAMNADSALVGLTGQLIADGAHTGEISFDAAVEEIAAGRRPDGRSHECSWLYGCNMVVRLSAAPDLRFDEMLPLYGWQEDVDYSCQLARHGHMVCSSALTGIHLGTRAGRTSGLRFGYSQVANILYLRRKQTISWRHGFGLMARNIVANLTRSIWPEPEIDRRGRLVGNALAIADRLRGRIDPTRVESL
ncbi:MAG: glycosyltransferase [Sphingomonadales bacterium]|nr:glycosyltransferase [Sphingomonadales bacterium]